MFAVIDNDDSEEYIAAIKEEIENVLAHVASKEMKAECNKTGMCDVHEEIEANDFSGWDHIRHHVCSRSD